MNKLLGGETISPEALTTIRGQSSTDLASWIEHRDRAIIFTTAPAATSG